VEVPLSKVIVPLPKGPTTKVMQETDSNFVARVAKVANHLVGNYILVEHRACMD
jgi:hypothetical protein